MAVQPEVGLDLVTVCTDATDGGTLVRVVAPSRHIRMVDLMPVFEALDLNLVSYTAERDPDANGAGPNAQLTQAPLGRRKHSFRGRFLVTDADGQNLSDDMLDGLVARLQEALHVRLSRPTRCSALHEEARRGSVASYATEASMDLDSPSYVAQHGHHHNPLASHQGAHSLSHLHPGTQCFSSHHQLQSAQYPYFAHPYPHTQHPQLQPHPQQQYQPHHHPQQQQQYYQQQYPHHEHTASAGSMLLSDHSMSSISSLLRATSGAASDHPTAPSPSAMSRHETGPLPFLQQQSDAAFLDTPPHHTAAVGPLLAARGGSTVFDDRERYGSAAAVTPFATAATAGYHQQPCQLPHHQHTQSQPPSQQSSQAADTYGPTGLPRASSACSTPANVSGSIAPLITIGGALSPDADSATALLPPAAAAATSTAGPAAVSTAAAVLAAAGRTPHVSFYEPPAACTPASTSVATTSATTPLLSRLPSTSTSLISGATSSLPIESNGSSAGGAGRMTTACDAAAAAATAAAERSGSISESGQGPGDGNPGIRAAPGIRLPDSGAATGGEDGSPSSASDDRDGAYTWWSTFSAQDTVARIMSHPVRSISAEADLGQAKTLMTKHNISALLVDTGGSSPGFITKRDFLKVQFSKNFKRTKVKDVMTQPVIFVDINLPIEQCSRVLEARGVRRVLVHDPSRVSNDDPLSAFVGVVSDADLFKCMGAPAMSPVVSSMNNSMDQAHPTSYPGYVVLPVGSFTVPHMPAMPSLSPLASLTPASSTSHTLLPVTPGALAATPGALHHQAQADTQPHQQPSSASGLQASDQQGQQVQLAPTQHAISQQQQQQQGQSLPPQVSSAASTASASVSNSAGPSHAASMAAALSTDATMAPTASSAAAAVALAMAGSCGSVVRLHAESSLADRYRCAAALWELDFNELEVTRRIGEGSFGEVLLANFRGTKVAVKRLRGFDVGPDNPDTGAPGETGPSPTQMPIFRQFFEREIEILATIRHPNVVNFIGACHTPPNVCLVTEYCARGSLDHLLHKSSITLDLLKKVEFSMDIARGMSCLHSQKPPIIHRDLKTANLLVSARFEVKVADFGLSRIKDHAQLINSRAGLEGTVEYAAPEVLRGEPYTENCDIWSYAVLLWEIIHRQRPYADADVPIYILMMSLGNGSLRLPPVREEVATPGLARLVDRCMAWHPAERPSFREVLHALEAEYKILRGKAAAVPRSDSASSMMVLPGTQNRQGQPVPAESAPALAAPHEYPHVQPHMTTGTASRPAQVPGAPAQQPTPHQSALVSRRSSKLGLNPHGNASGVVEGGVSFRPGREQSEGEGREWSQEAGPSQPQQLASRPRVKLALPSPHQSQQAGGSAGSGPHAAALSSSEVPDPISPADSTSRPSSSRTAGSITGRTGGGGGTGSKPGSAGRPVGRSLRSAARSKSMPLPELEWFAAEDSYEEFGDTTDSIADDDADAAASTATSTSGVATTGAAATAAATPYPDDAGAYGDPVVEAPGGLPHHLVVRVPRPGAGGLMKAGRSGAGAGTLTDGSAAVETDSGSGTGVVRFSRPHVSAFAAAAAFADEAEDEQAGARRGVEEEEELAEPLRVLAAAAAAAAAAAVGTAFTGTSASLAAFRQSPFHMASNSPFATAADLPWSPHDADEPAGLLASHLSAHLAAAASQRLGVQVVAGTNAATAAAAASASPAPHRVMYVSPFAQMASAAPSPPAEEEEGNQEGEEERRAVAAAAARSQPATANSTDVNTAVEKDQRASLPDPYWAVLGSCSKPPSGDVYGNGTASRVSTSVRPPSPPTLAAVYAAAQRGTRASSDESDDAAGVVSLMRDDGDGIVPGAGASADADVVLATVEATAAAAAAAVQPGLLPPVLSADTTRAYGSQVLVVGPLDSDQFDDDEDDDAALHTTAWVRL